MSDEQELLLMKAYAAYNGQDVDGLLALVSDDVDWPNGSDRLRTGSCDHVHRIEHLHIVRVDIEGLDRGTWSGRWNERAADRPRRSR